MASELARKAAELAARDLNVREQPDGSNDSPRIRQYLFNVGIREPASYCAAAVSTWILEAGNALGVFPRIKTTGGAQRLYFLNSKLAIFARDLTPDDVPCVYVENHGGGLGHAGIVVGFDPETGRFQDISGNTTDKATREGGTGQGVYALDKRSIHDARLLGFVRIE